MRFSRSDIAMWWWLAPWVLGAMSDLGLGTISSYLSSLAIHSSCKDPVCPVTASTRSLISSRIFILPVG
jgi:hypothetical protein